MKVTEINVTDKAKKKIKSISKSNNLDYDLVYYIFCFHWNYDGVEGEWVTEIQDDEESQNRYEFIFDNLKLTDEILDKTQVIDKIYNRLKNINETTLNQNFISGATQSNYCSISEYASFYYLTNATKEKLFSLEWKSIELTKKNIIWQLFLKIFRGGSVDRYNLEYLYVDLVLDLPYTNQMIKNEDWVENFINKVNDNRKKINLTALIVVLKEFCKGNKYYLQTVLEALSYSNRLKVESHFVDEIFLPDFRNKLSPNFYSNEWTYPLRFWNQSNK